MAGKARKKSTTRAPASRPARALSGSTQRVSGKVAAEDVATPADPAPSPQMADRLRLFQQLSDTAARGFRGLTKSLTHRHPLVRMVGLITWLWLLTLLTAVVMVPLFNWHPWEVLMTIGSLTGVVTVTNLTRRWLRRSD